MTHASRERSYRDACRRLTENARKIAEQNDAYRATFPAAVWQGLFSSEVRPKKEVAQRYYLHAAALCRLLTPLEEDVVAVGGLMQEADRAMDSRAVLLLDAFFERYRHLRGALNDYLNQSEAVLQRSTETVSPAELAKPLRDLQAQVALWRQFLEQEAARESHPTTKKIP